jgi:hypothetical protein
VARKAFFEQGQSPETSIKQGSEALLEAYGDFECPEDSAKSKEKMLEALWEYFIEYPLQSNPIVPLEVSPGKFAIEFTFAIPLPINHPETGNPLIYGGRFDMLAAFNHTKFAVDEKTASQLGPSWAKQWELDSQFTGYCWAAQQYNYDVAGAIVRGISILKTKFGHSQAIVYRPQWMIDRWHKNLLFNIEQMLSVWNSWRREGFIPLALDKSICSNYGGCAYHRLCQSQDPLPWIEADFGPRHWNPLHINT